MADRSKIEWTDATWNPVTGCTKVSTGCAHCYAERLVRRFGSAIHGVDVLDTDYGPEGERLPFSRIAMHRERLEQPFRWRKPRRIFVCSMGDLFHEDVSDEFITQVFAVMALAKRHTFQVLTKRPQRILRWFSEVPGATRDALVARDMDRMPWVRPGTMISHGIRLPKEPAAWPLPNVWLGVSCEDQERANERIPMLIHTPAAVRFVSLEPLLGPIDLKPWLPDPNPVATTGNGKFDPGSLDSVMAMMTGGPVEATGIRGRQLCLDWVIVGGETGPRARPMDLDWVRSIRDQCQAARAPFFFKQWGGVHKKKNGRDLDGRTWDEMPRC